MLLEVMIVMAVISTLASIALPLYVSHTERARSAVCLANRETINKEIMADMAAGNNPPESLSDVGYPQSLCPSGGVYVLVPAAEGREAPTVACSLHHWPKEKPPPPPLTSLGSTFDEITGAMITRVQQFHGENGRYPRSWGDYAFTDVGLAPDEWKTPFDGVYYATGGNRIKVTPAEGYVFHMTGAGGAKRVLKSGYNWSLWYSMSDGKWYYHSIKDENEIDISTLVIEKEGA
jgi:type II secretory pathway pseudopilin PulG